MIAEFRGESKSKLTDCGNLLNESPMFTKTAFVDAIVGLVVTEDLISDVMSFLVSFWVLICYGRCFKPLSIVESVSLQRLFLMLRKELRDSDIPHKTTIRDRVEEVLMEHFDNLEKEMHVSKSFIHLLWIITLSLNSRTVLARFRLPMTCGLTQISFPSWW